MSKVLLEGLDHKDFKGQIKPIVTVDEYVSKMGKNKDIVTITFTVKSKIAGDDLIIWFERGYDWVLDASLSDGEVSVGQWLVFVEMNRRSTVPARLVELLDDLETLTELELDEWTVIVENEEYKPDVDILKDVIILNPGKYAEVKETELNEFRNLSGLEPKKIYEDIDSDIKDYIAKAGL